MIIIILIRLNGEDDPLGIVQETETDKWYKHGLESILENETHKIILSRRLDLEMINKKKKKKKKRKKIKEEK